MWGGMGGMIFLFSDFLYGINGVLNDVCTRKGKLVEYKDFGLIIEKDFRTRLPLFLNIMKFYHFSAISETTLIPSQECTSEKSDGHWRL